MNTMRNTPLTALTALTALLLLWTPAALADDGGVLLGGKIGGGLAFSDLGPHPAFALELGYVFPAMDGAFGAMLDVSYSAPKANGAQDDARVPGGSYKWRLTEKELILQPTFLYRLTFLHDRITPYAGIGPRIYMLQSVENGDAGDVSFPETTEQSTKVGFGLPLGVGYRIGPGHVIVELLLQWGPLDHRITGDSNLGTATLWLGYRALL